MLTPSVLRKRSLSLEWTCYQPERLGRDDFGWENAPRIETPRLSFRNWRTDDQYNFAAIRRMPGVMPFHSGELSDSDSHEEAAHYAALGLCGRTFWVLERKSDQRMLGVCGLVPVNDGCTDAAGQHELGWMLRPDAWGQGYAYEAAQAVVNAGFEEWGLRKIIARVYAGDGASRRLVERLGMRENPALQGTLEVRGRPVLFYEMDDRAFWELGRTPPSLKVNRLE